MTEDYFRRLFPQNLPVLYQKIKAESLLDLGDNCNDICVQDFNSPILDEKETNCLKRCFNKSVEFDSYLTFEFDRIFVKEVKEFKKITGV